MAMIILNEFTRAGILLNAIKAPYEIFIKLCENHEPEELLTGGEKFFEELGLKANAREKLSKLISEKWHEKEIEKLKNLTQDL